MMQVLWSHLNLILNQHRPNCGNMGDEPTTRKKVRPSPFQNYQLDR